MPLPLTVSCFSEIQIGFTFLVLAHPGSAGPMAVKRVCVCVLLDRYGVRFMTDHLTDPDCIVCSEMVEMVEHPSLCTFER